MKAYGLSHLLKLFHTNTHITLICVIEKSNLGMDNSRQHAARHALQAFRQPALFSPIIQARF
ncbi:hypothetical protein [Pseudomonas oryziphila]|uniref:Uncharacterized protein n=1 Tax=Pseudomonas entomophila TaxID=312306 RepID=A0A3S8UJW8_9PSED|nr:hypothetical protein [Pseudomonas oryziphila]AZL68705.1 hypothetical protein EJA05_13605 [Pseudomonas oryziphila]